MQGCFIRRVCIVRRIVFNAYLTVLNNSCRIIRLDSLPFLDKFWPF